ncbi:MAG: hypothetical protein ACM3N5_16990 [Candidatus Eiseniibacteriota bacterium]
MNRRSLLSVASFAAALILAYLGAEIWLTRKLDERVEALAHQLPPSVTLNIGDSSVRLFGYEARVSDLVLSGPAGRIRIDAIAFDHFDFGHDVPQYASGTVHGLAIDAGEVAPEGRALLASLGYQKVVLDVAFDYRFEPEKSLFMLNNLRISGPRVGRLAVSGEIANVATLAPETPLATFALMLRAALNKATLRYEDDGLVERIQTREAKRAGIAVADYRAQLARNIDDAMAKTADDRPREAMARLKAFVEHPRQLTVTAMPREPVPLFRVASARNPATALRLLDVTVINGP